MEELLKSANLVKLSSAGLRLWRPWCTKKNEAPKIQLGDLGERCELPQRGLGRSPSRNRIWCIIA